MKTAQATLTYLTWCLVWSSKTFPIRSDYNHSLPTLVLHSISFFPLLEVKQYVFAMSFTMRYFYVDEAMFVFKVTDKSLSVPFLEFYNKKYGFVLFAKILPLFNWSINFV